MQPAKIVVATPEHAPALARLYAPYVTDTAISFEEVAPTEAEMARKIEEILAVYPWLVAEVDGVVAGFAYACAHRPRAAYRWSVDVSVYVDPRFQRRGIGSDLYRRLFDILRAQGFYNAHAGITQPNEASVRTHETLGFRRVGLYDTVGYKLGRWHTTGWWQLALRDKLGPPEEFIPFRDLPNS